MVFKRLQKQTLSYKRSVQGSVTEEILKIY